MAFAQWAAGMKLTASRLAGITPKFQQYTPTWATFTGVGPPSWGNTDLSKVRWCQTGDLVIVNWSITFGSTTVFGTGGGSDNYIFGLPPVRPKYPLSFANGNLSIAVSDAQSATLAVRLNSDGITFDLRNASGWPQATAMGTGVMDAVTPSGAWIVGSVFAGGFMYEAA